MSQPADNTLDHNEIEQIRQFVASQNGSVSEGNGPTAMSQEQDKVSTKYPSGVTVVENLMNRDESQPVVASSSKSSEAPDAAAVTGIQGSVDENVASEWPEVQEEDSTGFDIIETWYNTLESPTLEDTVNYEKAKQKDARRRERIASRKALEEAEQTLETFPDLFDDELLNSSLESLPGDTGRRSDMPSANRPSKGPRKQKNRVSAAERRRSMQLGLESALGRVTRNKGSGKKRSRKRKADDSEEDIPASSNVSKKHLFDPEFDLNAFLNSDVIADAQANAGLPAIPISNSKNKKSALAELVASIPSADQDQAKSDRQAILEATTKFRHKARPDGKGGWRIKGMKTSLFHHQLLGVAWMRDRENSGGPPYGGFLCDVMGYGKTIQALANIVDGRCVNPDEPVKTTLIVVPPHLVGHWECQVVKHCEKDAVGDVLIYCAQSRMRSIDIIQSLQKFSVIITTYDEVRRSYPQLNRRGEVLDQKEIVEMWEELYAKEIGPLHQIKFLRIILDEGHAIKNHLASTSIAVRALTGHHKWILSGTPVPKQDDYSFITEFYPHFDFLEYPDTNDYSQFVKRYCVGDEAQQRLRNLCRTYILLRTHSSRLFSLPIIKLPDIGESVIKVDFCDVERRIYDEVLEQFIANINVANWVREDPDAKGVVFTQFLDFVRIFSSICAKEGWAHCRLTGKMSVGARDLSMNEFREKQEVKVMIASLMAGGTGIDMSMANKCILVDLWWNEAVQQQAFCRLYRIGQEKVVEVVKIIVQNTIDDYILQLQTKKSVNINKAIGEEALQKRDKIIDLLKMFAEVEVQENGGIRVEISPKGEQADKGDQAKAASKAT
ncbi:hypothetical protein LV161_004723 [Aspergillus fumigatus]|nr:hypothetical protein LV161_004723 [Aspergillus fumigatus]KAJ8221212.1 hypothetical protein LV158_001112 [Aspergillus fumigatus]KAJ8237902.1 hypothetical protein LV156_002496 [Aspergillus fumigatus]